MLLGWCGRAKEASKLLEETLATVNDEQAFRPFGGRQAFEQQMRDSIEHPDTVKHTVQLQVQGLAVGDVPTEEFAS